MSQQPALVDGVDNLVCDGKTLRSSIDKNCSAAATFIAQVNLYSQALGVAIAQTTYGTDESCDVLVQAVAPHGNRPFFSSFRSSAPTT
jgi:hypothetical protein